jgi:hypothetical protein
MSSEGIHNPVLVSATIGTPLAPGNIAVNIPGLPQGLTFPFPILGKAADGFFTKASSVDFASLVTGAENNTAIVINPNDSGNFTITLQHGTLACRILSILFNAQKLMGLALPIFTFPVSYRDNNCTPAETHDGFNCLIMRSPDVSYGAQPGTLAWGFVATTIISNNSSRLV